MAPTSTSLIQLFYRAKPRARIRLAVLAVYRRERCPGSNIFEECALLTLQAAPVTIRLDSDPDHAKVFVADRFEAVISLMAAISLTLVGRRHLLQQ